MERESMWNSSYNARQTLLILSQQLVSGCGLSFHHAEQVERAQFEQATKERSAAINASCIIKSAKGPNVTRWLRLSIGFQGDSEYDVFPGRDEDTFYF
eukprot:1161881-Pelagomonas_calceolata.AAC.1